MPEGFDANTGRLYFRTKALTGGINLSLSKRILTESEASRMYNVLPRFGKIVPGSQKEATAKWTLGEDIYLQFAYNTVTDRKYVLMGTTKCWVYTSTSPTEKTPAAPFTNSQPIWKGATLLHNSSPVVVVTNFGNDYPHYYDGGGGLFIPLTNAPKVRTFCGYLGRIFTGNIYDSGGGVWRPNRIQWSAFTNLTYWDYATYPSAGYLDLNNSLDHIYNIEVAKSNILVIFRRFSIYIAYPNALAENPISDQFNNNHGIYAPNSLQRAGDMFFYLGDDDVYKFTLNEGSTSIGARIRDELFSLYSPAAILYVWSFLDSINKDYYLVTKLADNTYRAWIYNYEQDSWTLQDFETNISLGVWYA
jgi:hypothetical protein